MPIADQKRLYFVYVILYLLVAAGLFYVQSLVGSSGASQSARLFRAASGAFGISFAGFLMIDRYVWRLPLFRLIAGIKTPVLHGRWEGTLHSSYSEHKLAHPVVIEIRQTLHRTSLRYYDENAITHSRLVGFSTFEPEGSIVLLCVYYNQPIVTNQASLQAHSGVMELYFDDDGEIMNGVYYNNPHQRVTYGHMALRLESRQLLGRFKEIESVGFRYSTGSNT